MECKCAARQRWRRGGAYSLGASYDLSSTWSIRGSRANAFNRPTLGQSYDPYYGNTALKAERARNQEFGVQWASGVNLAKLTYHRSTTYNMFGFNPSTYQWINIGEVRNHGLELLAEAAVPCSGGKLCANANTQNPVNQANNTLMARRAKEHASLGLQGAVGSWTWDVSTSYMGARNDTDYSAYPSTAVRLKSFVKLDANIAYAFDSKAFVSLALSNLGKANDQTAYGYSGKPRGAVLRLNYKL
jgi:vitamin B12 transporter